MLQTADPRFQELRLLFTKIRADFVGTMAKEGQFITLENGFTFHYREKSGDSLLGIFMEDLREKDKAIVYLAERGQTVEQNGNAYLVLEKGSVQRKEPNSRDSSIVAFERYAVDLSAFNKEGGDVVYKPRERSTTQSGPRKGGSSTSCSRMGVRARPVSSLLSPSGSGCGSGRTGS